jgi:hypothetical protein
MTSEDRLREKLHKIEALYAGATTAGENPPQVRPRNASGVSSRPPARRSKPKSSKFSIPDPWSRQLFIALCRGYGMKPFRYSRMHRQTVIVRAPASFVQMTLYPEFEELSHALTTHLDDITKRINREEVHEATQDAEEINEPRRLR